MELKKHDDAPHTAIISIACNVYEKMVSGELNGSPKKNIKKTIEISGATLDDCMEKVNAFVSASTNR